MKQRLLDQFVQNWQTSLSDSSKALNYRIFKTKFEFEEYFNILNIGDASDCVDLGQQITIYRLKPVDGEILIEETVNRYCNLCNCQKLGDEYHYVLESGSSLNDKRKQFLSKYFMKRHNVVKKQKKNPKNQSLLRKLCIFIKHINKIFCTPGLPTVVP